MTPHPHQLYAVPFTEADQVRLVGFSCGGEPWSKHVAEWILGSDVFDSMKRGTRVWLFETEAREIVGFGSIGTSRWKWPLPDGAYTKIVLLPMLGIAEQFIGQPSDPEWRYSLQIIEHLIAEARQLTHDWPDGAVDKLKWLALTVHRDNARAIRFYERCGFKRTPRGERNNGHIVMSVWIGD